MTLQLYLLRQLLVSIGFALAGLGFLILPAITVQAVHKLEGAGLPALVRYVPLVAVELVPYIAPIAFLLGVVATFGRLSADNEWTAIRMAGIHPVRVLLPGLVLALLGVAGTHHLLATVSPNWKYAQRSFLRTAKVDALHTLGQGRTQFSINRFFLSAARRVDNTFFEVVLGIPLEDEEDVLVIVADAIKIDFPPGTRTMEIFFSNAQTLRDDDRFSNESPMYRLDLDDLVNVRNLSREAPKYLTNATMQERLQQGAAGEPLPPEKLQTYRYEIQRRRALSATYLVFLLLGSATGLLLRSGTQLGALAAATGYAFLYYILSMRVGRELAEVGLIPPGVAAWTVNALYLAVGLSLVRRQLWR